VVVALQGGSKMEIARRAPQGARCGHLHQLRQGLKLPRPEQVLAVGHTDAEALKLLVIMYHKVKRRPAGARLEHHVVPMVPLPNNILCVLPCQYTSKPAVRIEADRVNNLCLTHILQSHQSAATKITASQARRRCIVQAPRRQDHFTLAVS